MPELKIFSGENAVEEFREYIFDHELRTSTKFVLNRFTKKVSKLERSDFVRNRIFFELNSSRVLPLEYDGVPFFPIAYEEMECHQGPVKKPYRKKMKPAHKTRIIQRESKKLNCQACIYVRSMVCFPTYKVERNADHARRVMRSKLQDDLANEEKQVAFEFRVFVLMPDADAHNHPLGEGESISMDKMVSNKVHSLVACGVKCVEEMERHITAFSRANFPAAAETNRRFFPSRKNLKCHIGIALNRWKSHDHIKRKHTVLESVGSQCRTMASSIHEMLSMVLSNEVYKAIFSDLLLLQAKLKSLVSKDATSPVKVLQHSERFAELNRNLMQSNFPAEILPVEDETEAAVSSVLQDPLEQQHIAAVDTVPTSPEYVAYRIESNPTTAPCQDETQAALAKPSLPSKVKCKLVYYCSSATDHSPVELSDVQTGPTPSKLARKHRCGSIAPTANGMGTSRSAYVTDRAVPIALTENETGKVIPITMFGQATGTGASTNLGCRLVLTAPPHPDLQAGRTAAGIRTTPSKNMTCRLVPIPPTAPCSDQEEDDELPQAYESEVVVSSNTSTYEWNVN